MITLWNKSHACSTSAVNHWNTYSSYFKDNLKDELVRLGRKAPEIYGTPSTTVRCNCYELFKAAFPDTWQSILQLHEQSMMLLGIPQTVAMWGQEFQKFCTKISGLMDCAAARHGFEAAVANKVTLTMKVPFYTSVSLLPTAATEKTLIASISLFTSPVPFSLHGSLPLTESRYQCPPVHSISV
ncbi:hypothetical protein BDR07DRAFT_1490721 [Suillus spraguei]|nr:hypothetical protein BDR07DRAFT_1490721 [Suillus spraguei]